MKKTLGVLGAALLVAAPAAADDLAHVAPAPEAVASEAAVERMPFRDGERLIYEVSLLGLTAGAAELRAEGGDGGAWRFFASGRTTGATDSIFGLRQSATCTVQGDLLKPEVCLFTSRQRKGLKRREVRYDHASGDVSERTLENGKRSNKTRNFGEEGIHEAVSGLYLLRKDFPDMGETMSFRAIRKGKPLVVEAEALRRETVKTEAGTFQAVLVDLRIITKVDRDAAKHAQVWFSDDDRRIPIKVSVDAPVGSLVAELVEASGTGALARR